MINRYRCDDCGCYLDPVEYNLCDECREKRRQRVRHAETMKGFVTVGAGRQYEFIFGGGDVDERVTG